MKCNTCGGTYETMSSDGFLYFHACPPMIVSDVERDGSTLTVAGAGLKETDKVLATRTVERDGHRDENVRVKGFDPSGRPIVDIKRAGNGAAVVSA